MIYFTEAQLQQLSIHSVGNKLQEGHLVLSEEPVVIGDELLGSLLKQYFGQPFEKVNGLHRFYHPSNDLALNEIWHFASALFAEPARFHELSRQVATQLYESSDHPNIKPGELYVAFFKDVQLQGELFDALGIFKSENKESYLKVSLAGKGFSLEYEQEGIDIRKLDKGCLVFNTAKEEGYRVAVIDQTNRADTVYWKDDFLQVRTLNDNYQQTQNVLGVYKSFVTGHLDEEFEISKTDKIDLLNRSMKYFKEKESFDLEEFAGEVIGNPQGIESFRNYKRNYEEEFEAPIPDSFEISGAAVKKQARVYKSVLKLDKNFHIYVHGNKDLIERGFDDGRDMNYYKVYFREEA